MSLWKLCLPRSPLRKLGEKSPIKRYTEMMSNGEWVYNGEPVIFGDDGLILDGHHRLHACVQSGVPFVTDLSFGRPRDGFSTIDTGKFRSISHIAGLSGISDPRTTSTAYKWLYRLETDKLGSEGFNTKMPGYVLPELYARHPRLPDSVKLIPNGIKSFLTLGVAVFLHYYLSTVDSECTDRFFEHFVDGSGLSKDNAILVLRNNIIANKSAKKRSDLDNIHDMALVIKAWNHWRDGKKIKQIKWSRSAEEFPTPH